MTHHDKVKKHKYSESDDLYDQDILTKRLCPKCSERIISHSDCTERCTNPDCDYQAR